MRWVLKIALCVSLLFNGYHILTSIYFAQKRVRPSPFHSRVPVAKQRCGGKKSAYEVEFPSERHPRYAATSRPRIKADVHVLVLVFSARENFARRATARGWAARFRAAHRHSAVHFLVGTHPFNPKKSASLPFMTKEAEITANLVHEARINQDIMFVADVDCYHCSSRKMSAGIVEAVANFNFKWIVKVDDDVTFDYAHVLPLLSRLDTWSQGAVVVGNMKQNSRVMRCGRWGYTHEQWPGTVFPDFPQGVCYALSSPAAEFISVQRQQGKLAHHVWGEDVAVGVWLNGSATFFHNALMGHGGQHEGGKQPG